MRLMGMEGENPFFFLFLLEILLSLDLPHPQVASGGASFFLSW